MFRSLAEFVCLSVAYNVVWSMCQHPYVRNSDTCFGNGSISLGQVTRQLHPPASITPNILHKGTGGGGYFVWPGRCLDYLGKRCYLHRAMCLLGTFSVHTAMPTKSQPPPHPLVVHAPNLHRWSEVFHLADLKY